MKQLANQINSLIVACPNLGEGETQSSNVSLPVEQ